MKKICCLYAAVALMAPLIVGAVPWQMDSSPFVFPGSGVKLLKQSNGSQAFLKYKQGICRGYVTFQYSLPQGIKTARLDIYDLFGKQIESLGLSAGANSVQWSIAKRNVAAGIYLAAMRYGSFENKIQISIVK
jgi:hypothetical protein